jgi:hypothetical protein
MSLVQSCTEKKWKSSNRQPVSFLLCLLLFCWRAPVGRAADSTSTAAPQAALTSLVRQIEGKRVNAVEITYIPTYILYNVNVSPQKLLDEYRYRLMIRQFQDSQELPLLTAALRQTKLNTSTRSADLRWGIIFHLIGGSAREIYLDGFGRLGQIDDKRATFDGGLYDWLRQYAACLK